MLPEQLARAESYSCLAERRKAGARQTVLVYFFAPEAGCPGFGICPGAWPANGEADGCPPFFLLSCLGFFFSLLRLCSLFAMTGALSSRRAVNRF
jgi:hypothetical protein